MGFFEKIKNGLSKTKNGVFEKVHRRLNSSKKIDDNLLDEIEEILISGDIGVKTTLKIVENLRSRIKKDRFENTDELFSVLKEEIEKIVLKNNTNPFEFSEKPKIILVIGVNGVGKTTSIGKLTKRFQENGKKVILGAADTFRAAAIDQLGIWADRNNCEIVKHKPGADPSAVAFDTVSAALARSADVAIIDTAGRLHNKENLMKELEKTYKAIQKVIPEAPHEIYLVLDSTMGQNAIQQAKAFQKMMPISSIVLTKLDGTAKGGVVIGISDELSIPVQFVGIGEGIDDMNIFEPKAFVEGIFE
jgi:fused signal recognition particle receptor